MKNRSKYEITYIDVEKKPTGTGRPYNQKYTMQEKDFEKIKIMMKWMAEGWRLNVARKKAGISDRFHQRYYYSDEAYKKIVKMYLAQYNLGNQFLRKKQDV